MKPQERFKIFLIDNIKITQIILKMYWKQNETGQKGFAKYQNDTNKTKNDDSKKEM